VKKLNEALVSGQILMYGFTDIQLPVELDINTNNRISIYLKNPKKYQHYDHYSSIKKYCSTKDIGWDDGDVFFLDNEAIKGVLVGYPSASPNVLLALDRPKYWIWLFIGVFRRIVIRQVKIKGLIRLGNNKKRTWLVLERLQQQKSNSFYFSHQLGIQGLIDGLRRKNLNYVALRFYQKFPKLYRKGGDIDILVSDEDTNSLKDFILENPGNIRVDVWNVSEPNYKGMSYYLPRLATQIINNSEIGPAGSRIPCKKDSLLSLIYHALYHKGLNSGILTTTPGLESINILNNPYIKEIQNIANELNIKIGLTMEELDDFMHQEDWRPKIDTLAKIAQWNEWVRVRFFNSYIEKGAFSVFILRESAVKNFLVDDIKAFIKKKGFKVIQSTLLEGNERINANKYLRGGTWKDAMYSETSSIFEPAYAIVLADLYIENHDRFSALKEQIRHVFDTVGPSIVHSTDNEFEAWDYVDYCFPGYSEEIASAVKEVNLNKKKKPILSKWINYFKFFPFYRESLTTKLRNRLIRLLTE